MTEEDIKKLPVLLTVPQAAEILSIGKNAVYGLIQQKQIPVLVLGPRKHRIPKEELLEWIKNSTNHKQVH